MHFQWKIAIVYRIYVYWERKTRKHENALTIINAKWMLLFLFISRKYSHKNMLKYMKIFAIAFVYVYFLKSETNANKTWNNNKRNNTILLNKMTLQEEKWAEKLLALPKIKIYQLRHLLSLSQMYVMVEMLENAKNNKIWKICINFNEIQKTESEKSTEKRCTHRQTTKIKKRETSETNRITKMKRSEWKQKGKRNENNNISLTLHVNNEKLNKKRRNKRKRSLVTAYFYVNSDSSFYSNDSGTASQTKA